jgi:two-component system sensor kinase FixL
MIVLTMNKLLQHQIESFLGSAESMPQELAPLFQAIGDTYDSFDAGRHLLERSRDAGSEELLQINERLRREVGERQQTQEKLQHAISLLTATLESTADGILVIDRQGKVRGFNRKFAELWRIPDALFASGEDERLLSFVLEQLADPQGFLDRVQQLYREPAAESSETLYFKDGRVFERYSKPQLLGNEIVGRVWSFRDVTTRVQAQDKRDHLVQELEEASHRLEMANGELNDFAHVVSHDLKAPLRGIRTLADWIAADCADQLSPEAQEQLGLLCRRIDHMQSLIDGILQYSRVGRVSEERTRIDLKELVAEVIDMLAPPANVEITITDELPVAELERTRIFQVFQNLLSNAIKYLDKPVGHITIGCRDEGPRWTFRVADNGPGIDEKYHEKIFQLFQTLAPGYDAQSTGIGLTLVKKIVESCGGEVWVESVWGEGSTFFFTLPKMQGELENERLQASTAGGR